MNLSPNALTVLERRYLLKDVNGKVIETPEQMFRRVAKHVAQAELNYGTQIDVDYWEEQFYDMMINLDALPNSPTMFGAGFEDRCLSACFVLDIGDSMDSIFNAIKLSSKIFKMGGGCGYSFSKLRPEGDSVGTTGGVSSGPISFMRVFDVTTDVIKQGSLRRGAALACLKIDHPDIMKFISCKDDGKSFSNFNLSVSITDKFMDAVINDADFELVNPRNNKVTQVTKARYLFNKIAEHAWKTGDPGVIFIDTVNKTNPIPELGEITSPNPCSESFLLPNESCNLASINLYRCVDKSTNSINFLKLEQLVKTCIRFLDNVIDTNHFPDPEIEKATLLTRKIGLGLMGVADSLAQCGIPYNSDAGLLFAEKVAKFVNERADEASISLAKERGSVLNLKFRNSIRTTYAPTGSLSIISNCSSGIEPLFALAYTRTILDGTKFNEINPVFSELYPNIKLEPCNSIQDRTDIPIDIRRVFVTAHDISPEWHVKMLATFQKHVGNSISKTVNMPHLSTVDDVENTYKLAYSLGCKGITIYRDGSKENQVLSTNKIEDKKVEQVIHVNGPRKRPKSVKGFTDKIVTGCGNMYVTVNTDKDGPCEVFVHLGKSGACACAQLEAVCRMISLSLRSGVDVSEITEQLKGIRCPSPHWEGGHAVLSCGDAIAKVLSNSLSEEEKVNIEIKVGKGNSGGQCPDCSGILIYQEGCYACHGCGYTKCG